MGDVQIVIGNRNTGKTVQSFLEISKQALNGTPCLLFDANEEFRGLVEIIYTNSVKDTFSGIKRINQYNEKEEIIPINKVYEDVIKKSIIDFSNGIFVIDEFDRYFSINDRISLFELFRKHPNVKYTLHYKMLERLPKELLVISNSVRVHYNYNYKFNERNKLKLGYLYDIFLIAQTLVNQKNIAKNTRYFYLNIDLKQEIIIGDYSRDDYRNACLECHQEMTNIIDCYNYEQDYPIINEFLLSKNKNMVQRIKLIGIGLTHK